ncbi:Asp23/Gls24 family envelope stress response protein [Actinomadura sp. B10D3]|uniref:Asp23/Gls24 family envelope stress response protein n=1 Tax=Actinomadura sp. B10D3 TaxID=3153557 RepID=UPI00325EEACC
MTITERGRTTIRDQAVARIVVKAAQDVEASGGLGRTIAGVTVPGRRPARTEVRVNGDIVTARVTLSVTYPMPVRTVARRVRQSVRDQVTRLTGLTVRQVDVDVAELSHPAAGERTVL